MSSDVVDGADDDDVIAEIFAETTYELVKAPPRTFKPWHRPRKQFVRSEQWLVQIKKLVSDLRADGPLRYLSLPGPDMLDVRVLSDALDGARTLRFLGFNRDRGDQLVELNTSFDEVIRLPPVDERSLVVPGDVKSVGVRKSLAYVQAMEHGPYDVINLDFCDNVLAHDVAEGSMYDAISNLMGLQERRLEPWLLLLTTRIDRAHVPKRIIDALDVALVRSLDECDGFAETVQQELLHGAEVPDGACLSTCANEDWIAVFGLGLTKWILGQAVETNASLELTSCMSYLVDQKHSSDDLLSLAFRITPRPRPAPDLLGLAGPSTSELDECALANRVVGRVARRVPVDTAIAENPNLREKLIDETAALLVKARYEEDAYRAWVADESANDRA